MIESLGRDKFGSVSSQPVIKTGENRGKCHPEKDGNWSYICGYSYEALQVEQSAHNLWANYISGLGFRIGSFESEGVVSFFLFKENVKFLFKENIR